MSGVHLHLLLNHAPIFGAFFACVLLVVSLRAVPEVLRRTALVLLIVTAFASVAADLSGEPAEEAIEGFPGVTRAAIHEHEEAAELALVTSAVLAAFAVGVLVRWRRATVPKGITYATLAGTLILSGAMAYAGWLGGQVRHTEVRPGATMSDATAIEIDGPGSGDPEGR